MSEIWISMREKKLSDTLTLMTDTLTRVTAERDRLSALADKWNLECDEMREDNKRLAAELASLRDSGVELPEPDGELTIRVVGRDVQIDAYRASTLTDYGDRRAMAERERAARVCDIHARGWEANPGQNPQAGFIAANNCAYAIRKGE